MNNVASKNELKQSAIINEKNKQQHVRIIYSNSFLSFTKIGKTYNIIIKPISNYPIINVGPDYLTAIMFISLIIALCLVVYYIVVCKAYWNFPRIKFWWKIIFSLMLSMFALTCLINPGIAYNDRKSNQEGEDKNYCDECEIYKENKMIHCYECNVCVKRMDHHCVLSSKCIGKYNIIPFYSFIVCAFALYGLSIVLVFYFLLGFTRNK